MCEIEEHSMEFLSWGLFIYLLRHNKVYNVIKRINYWIHLLHLLHLLLLLLRYPLLLLIISSLD